MISNGPDLREYLQEICDFVGIKFTMPERYVSHRWLSVYDVTVDTMRLWDVYQIFYFGFMDHSDRTHYLPKIMEIYLRRNVSEKSKIRIHEIHTELGKKNMTPEGTKRKQDAYEKLFIQAKNKTYC
jgi:hypothetical protein